MHLKELLRIYWFASMATILLWGLVGWKLGATALFTVIVLTLLETTFSADNAVVNSKVLVTMSPFWQKLFMTVGIFIAVFVVRFGLPIVIVAATTGISLGNVADLATHHPSEYEHALEDAAPVINAFGGTFLLMVTLSYFIDYGKRTHWLPYLEKYLGKLGKFDNITVFIMLISTLIIYATVDPAHHNATLLASIVAIALHVGLNLLNALASTAQKKKGSQMHLVGMAAFAAFMYLEVLDASFSLDGVIGAFALTGNIVLIIAGLGAGTVWIRAMTVHLVRHNVLSKYIYLEHGAHWAIGFLGAVMLLKLYHIELPEVIVGSLGLIFIALAIWWSKHTASRLAPTSATE